MRGNLDFEYLATATATALHSTCNGHLVVGGIRA